MAVTWRVPADPNSGGVSSTITPSSGPLWMLLKWAHSWQVICWIKKLIVVLICPARLSAQGGRRVLYLYGYINQQVDGLSFPEDVSEPDKENVAAVTLEVMVLRTEVDMLIKVRVFDQGWASAPQLISNFVLLCHFFRAATLTQNTSGKSCPPSSFRCVEIITAYYDTGHPITQQQNQA